MDNIINSAGGNALHAARKLNMLSSAAKNATNQINAAADGHHKCLDLLIKANADINIKNNRGFTALIYAANKGHHKCVDLLIKANADINIKNDDGCINFTFQLSNFKFYAFTHMPTRMFCPL